MDDLQTMVDSLKLSEPIDGRQMDDLAEMLKNKLGLSLDLSAYRQLAENMVNLSISKQRSQYNDGLSNLHNHHSRSETFKQKTTFVPHSNSSFSNVTAAPLQPSANGRQYGLPIGNDPRRDVIDRQMHQSQLQSPPIRSPTVKQNRGRSPARSTVQQSSVRMSPIRAIFGGIPRASAMNGNPVNKSFGTSNENAEGTRSFSPSPGFGFLRRPRGRDENKETDKVDRYESVHSKGNTSTSVHSKGNTSTSTAFTPTSATDQDDHSGLQGIQGIQHTGTGFMRSDALSSSSLRVDQSSGASPQRQDLRGHGRSQSPHPEQLFAPSQNTRRPNSLGLNLESGRHCSAPSSPLYTVSGSAPAEKAPSRSGSPFNRPGLQEYGIGDETVVGRSPKRDVAVPTSTLGAPSGHRRTRSNGIDADPDSSRQPHIPRSYSKSPLRRPTAAPEQDSDSIRQPAPPRSFSQSPHRCDHIPSDDAVSAKYDDEISADIAMPDLSVPNFNGTSTPATGYPIGENELEVDQIQIKVLPKTAHGKQRRKDGTPFGGTSLVQSSSSVHPIGGEQSILFEIGTRPSVRPHRIPTKRSYNRADNRSEVRVESDGFDNDSRSHSPMEVETQILEHGQLDGFCIGVVKPNQQRKCPHRRHPSLDSNEQEASEDYIPKLHGSFSHDGMDATSSMSVRLVEPTPKCINVDYKGLASKIASKREEARSFYLSGDYSSTINAYSDALKVVYGTADVITSDDAASILSNRAAALLMIGAYQASIIDCDDALQKITLPSSTHENFSSESGFLLKVKLYTRKGRNLLKVGDYHEAYSSFGNALRTSDEAINFSRSYHSADSVKHTQTALAQMNTEATLGQADARRLRDACEKLTKLSIQKLTHPIDRSGFTDALDCVNMALAIASGSVGLTESKLILLAKMKRWREVIGVCERLSGFNVRCDHIYREDLANRNPFPGVQPATILKSDFFGNSREEDIATRELKLSSRASGEAVLRLPHVLKPFYLRALRLEERYPAAESAVRSLEEYLQTAPDHLKLMTHLSWIVKERSKLTRTKQCRERGDELFRLGDVESAATQYTICLSIDGEGISESVDGSTAGGRLHAVLHCNRAACLMTLQRFHAAIEECTAALRIHSRYMKAILRRARCYSRLQQTEESIAEYKRWLELVEQAKSNCAPSVSTPCIFDGPGDVKAIEVAQVKKELDDLYNAKCQADVASREEAERKREREKWQENFSSNWHPYNDAQQRRKDWFDQQDSSRRWDSFKDEGPRSRHHGRSKSQSESFSSSTSNHQQQSLSSPRSVASGDHYSALQLMPNATMEDIKKSFRRLAVKYHPDKNKDEGATENFLRIKLAHDTLSDPALRLQYDSELRRKGRF